MAQDSNRRFELLEAAIREQATVGRASAEAQVQALEAMTKKSSVVDLLDMVPTLEGCTC